MYSGINGEEIEADIFVGNIYYQRLRHMVSDKYQVRTTGPIDAVTHQPVKVTLSLACTLCAGIPCVYDCLYHCKRLLLHLPSYFECHSFDLLLGSQESWRYSFW